MSRVGEGLWGALLLALATSALPAAARADAVPAAITSALEAPDRDPKDRREDGVRRTAELLAFSGIAAGMRVGEIAALGGYGAETLARVVGPNGRVLAHQPPSWQRFGAKEWAVRAPRPIATRIESLATEFDRIFPADGSLDMVFASLVYHDLPSTGVDRAVINRNVFASLKPGGVYLIVDNSAVAGSGLAAVGTFHRIDEAVVKAEVLAAGFKLDREGSFLRNAGDNRQWLMVRKSPEERAKVDRFVLRFVKPR